MHVIGQSELERAIDREKQPPFANVGSSEWPAGGFGRGRVRWDSRSVLGLLRTPVACRPKRQSSLLRRSCVGIVISGYPADCGLSRCSRKREQLCRNAKYLPSQKRAKPRLRIRQVLGIPLRDPRVAQLPAAARWITAFFSGVWHCRAHPAVRVTSAVRGDHHAHGQPILTPERTFCDYAILFAAPTATRRVAPKSSVSRPADTLTR